MKLSRTGWNNVIIFSVMIFILVINVTNKKLYSSTDQQDNEQQTLFAEHAVILSLAVNQQVVIERIGRTWRATPAKISGQALEQMMLTWHEIAGNIVIDPPELDHQMALVITVELAGETPVQLLNLFITDNELLVFNRQQKRWLTFPLVIFSQLIPNEVLAS
ncbi:hypothetical protein [Colwellia hornerae]|uniref:DUF4340 domain-containing protein n=1 Tax=Colwellia hornerae TaxID=89402 RepID=A0A5C6QBX9_9GAMM|nr:hypothetical protein [Colwellia hornerae]TWX58502.1 hypothetical protein ESZ28_01655 [Colwellia hornerae]TWX58738.1 hypothetical protein ESZ26_11470 [Colwellia hornerae]TWX66614.1 hypothetical protein ESZ27_10300 [Colwellia hornerae]